MNEGRRLKALDDVGRMRLVSQRITRTTFKAADEVLPWLGAMQALDSAGTRWSIGLRLAGDTEAQVEEALASRSITGTWPMRGTLHFVAASAVRWLLALVSARSIEHSAGRHRQLELDQATFTRSKHRFGKGLEGGNQLSRDEMYPTLEKRGISTAGQRSVQMLWRAAQDGLICFGAMHGKNQTFLLLDDWAPDAKPMVRVQALAEITKRYFTSRGRATLQDFAWWMGLTLSDARAGLNMVKSQLIQETIDGQDFWMAPNLSMPRRASAAVHLPPGFDEYVLGYNDPVPFSIRPMRPECAREAMGRSFPRS